jgi:KEOPS complex subunit Cgi121
VIEEKDLLRYDKSKNRKLMEFFGITREEIEAVGEEKIPKLVMERGILLNILK